MNDQIRTMANDPAWLIHRYDPQQDCFHLRRVTRAERADATFLTDEYLPAAPPPLVLKRGDVMAALASKPTAPLHLIFHSAFCGSTLLAKAFDRQGMATALKEPVVLNDLIGWRQRTGSTPAWPAVTRDVLSAVARPFIPGEAVVVKPSNVVNAMAPTILDAVPAARGILMYAPLETFLTSVAKKGMEGRLWVRDLFAGLIREGATDLGYDGAQLFGQTDLQIAALGWLAQQRLFEHLLAGPRAERLRSLRSDRFLADPTRKFADAAAFFGLRGQVAAIGDIDVFSRHSKTGAAFDGADRSLEYRQAEERYGDEIGRVAIWAKHVADHNGIALDLARPL